MKYESYREGGVNEYEHKLITQVSYPVVVLERGLALRRSCGCGRRQWPTAMSAQDDPDPAPERGERAVVGVAG